MIPTRLLDIEISFEVVMIEYNKKFNKIKQPFFITLYFSFIYLLSFQLTFSL